SLSPLRARRAQGRERAGFAAAPSARSLAIRRCAAARSEAKPSGDLEVVGHLEDHHVLAEALELPEAAVVVHVPHLVHEALRAQAVEIGQRGGVLPHDAVAARMAGLLLQAPLDEVVDAPG